MLNLQHSHGQGWGGGSGLTAHVCGSVCDMLSHKPLCPGISWESKTCPGFCWASLRSDWSCSLGLCSPGVCFPLSHLNEHVHWSLKPCFGHCHALDIAILWTGRPDPESSQMSKNLESEPAGLQTHFYFGWAIRILCIYLIRFFSCNLWEKKCSYFSEVLGTKI